MHLLLYLYVGPVHTQPFIKLQIEEFSQANPNANVLELDASCHPVLFAAAEAAVHEAVVAQGQIHVIADCMQATGTESVGPLRLLIEKLIQHKARVSMQLLGAHAVLTPMLRIFAQSDV